MRSVNFSLRTILLVALSQVKAQTSTDCNPLQKSCPPNPGLGTSIFTDFTTGENEYWKPLEGTTTTYDSNTGAQFSIKAGTDAPTMVMTKHIMFGRVEMVARSSPGTGIISSFVLLSQDLDEIDWEWLGGDNNNVQTNFFGKGDTSSYDRGATLPVKTPIDTFHKYTIDWTAERILWEIDDNPIRTVNFNDPLTKGGSIYPQTPMKVKIGSWIGCLDASNPQTSGTCQWAGGQVDLTKGPFVMSVKSINVTDFGCGGDYSYTDNSGSFKSIKSTGTCDGKGTGPDPKTESKPDTDAPPGRAPGNAPVNPAGKDGTPDMAAPPASPVSAAPPVRATGSSLSTGFPSGNSTTNPNKSSGANGNSYPASSNTPSMKTNTSSSATTTSNANGKLKHNCGTIDIVVGILGLGLGFLVM
ncbi:putative glycosidase crf1 [Erysiphe necator]|nr:putative glycosidase crf1 [Erysiphe necator]